MKWKILFIIPLLFVGCVQDVIESEKIQLEKGVTKSSSERIVTFGTWTHPGTGSRTMQIALSELLAGDLQVNFRVYPITPEHVLLNEYFSDPCFIPAGQRYAEVNLPDVYAGWTVRKYNPKTDKEEVTIEYTTTYTIEIKSIEYNGDNNPLYIDQSKWLVKRSIEMDTYSWDISLISANGQKNYRYPYDVIGADNPNPGTNPGDGGGKPVDHPSISPD